MMTKRPIAPFCKPSEMDTSLSWPPYFAVGLLLWLLASFLAQTHWDQSPGLRSYLYDWFYSQAFLLGLLAHASVGRSLGLSSQFAVVLDLLIVYLTFSALAWTLAERIARPRSFNPWRRALLVWAVTEGGYCLLVFALGRLGVLAD